MKIKKITRWVMFTVGVLVVLGGVGIIGWKINDSIEKVSAYDEGGDDQHGEMLREHTEGVQDKSGEGEELHWVNELETSEGDGTLGLQYDARVKYPGVRTKNQHSEGLCWLYSTVTALEYNIAKNYENYEVSNKHLDYLTIDGRYVYKQTGATNVYFDRYLSVNGAFHRTDLGTSGANEELLYSMMNPVAIVAESDFARVMVNNDARLSGIIRYEDLWENSIISSQERNEILKNNFENQSAYMEKQDFDSVNDPSKVKYIVTGAKTANYGFDATRTVDSEVVETIKNLINKYGAVKISTFGTGDRFENCSDKKTVDGRDRYTFIVDNRVVRENPDDPESGILYECKANHGMTIVGWDDEWTYKYNNDEKRGAFILQNSWGEIPEDNMKWHLAYISAVPGMMYFDSVERYDAYDHYYGPNDYKESKISPADDEFIFELSLDENEQLNALAFNTLAGNHAYDVYVSDDGDGGNFVKDGTFEIGRGIIKYELQNSYDIEGDYAIKLRRTDGVAISDDSSRDRDTLNVMSNKIWTLNINNMGEISKETCRVVGDSCTVTIPSDIPIRTSYEFLGYAETPDATVSMYQPGDNIVLDENKTIYTLWLGQSVEPVDSDDDEDLLVPNTAGSPETGSSTQDSSGAMFTILPITILFATGIVYIYKRKGGHRKFE